MAKASSRLGKQLEEAIATLNGVGARFALIGGLALAPHKVVRATQDVDLLLEAGLADAVDRALTATGYKCIHRSADAANYLRGGWVNDPRRTQDLEDIKALIRANQSTLSMDEVRRYFTLFNHESLLREILNELK